MEDEELKRKLEKIINDILDLLQLLENLHHPSKETSAAWEIILAELVRLGLVETIEQLSNSF